MANEVTNLREVLHREAPSMEPRDTRPSHVLRFVGTAVVIAVVSFRVMRLTKGRQTAPTDDDPLFQPF